MLLFADDSRRCHKEIMRQRMLNLPPVLHNPSVFYNRCLCLDARSKKTEDCLFIYFIFDL